ncbi:hypothetical protein BDV3_005935 [Batrachochytrium dendrobatidis]
MHLYSATNRLVCLLLAVLAGLALISPLVTAQAYTSSLDYKTYLLSLKDGVGQDGLNTVVEFVHSVAGVVLTTYDSLPGIIKVEIPSFKNIAAINSNYSHIHIKWNISYIYHAVISSILLQINNG